MDANLVYEKTESGEAEVRQRNRVFERNVRTVLILVDGKSSVADLCLKVGNSQLVESALRKLERDALIVPLLARHSVFEHVGKLANEINVAAFNRPANGQRRPENKAASESELIREALNSASAAPPPFSMAPLSLAPEKLPDSSASFPAHGGAAPAHPSRTASARPKRHDKSSIRKRLSAVFAREVRAGDDGPIKPIRRGVRGPYISAPLAVSLFVVACLLLAALVFFLYPYDRHRPQLEAGLSRVAGLPIRIGEIKASLMPRPSISLERISGDDRNAPRAARIRLVPEWLSLLGAQPVFSSVEVESAYFPATALAALPGQLIDVVSPSAPATVRSVSFRQMEAAVLGLTIGDLHAEIRPEGSGTPPLTFRSGDRALTVTLKPAMSGFVATFEAYAWRPDADSRFVFDSLQGEALWDGGSLAIRSLDARIFDGSIQGVLLFSAEGRDTIAGDVSVRHINLRALAGALGYGSQFEGTLTGELKFAGSAPTWAEVLPSSSGAGSFVLQRGALGGLDLVEAVRRGEGYVRGGSTRYEQLSGRLTVAPELIRFSDLALSSGVLRAGGHAEVTRGGRLAGRVDVEMRGSANGIRMPIGLAGSLKEPILQGAQK